VRFGKMDALYEKMDPTRYTSDPLRSSESPQTEAFEPVGGGTPVDVEAERARTALGAEGAAEHHLNSAGSALPAASTLSAVIDHLVLEAEIGGYEAGAFARPRLEAVYAAAGELIGVAAEDIALVESATVGWRRAVDAMRMAPGDRVLATRTTYVSSALQLLELERSGIKIEIVPDDAEGQLDLGALEATLREPAALLAATHVPTSSGRVEPVAAIGALANAAGVPYLLDATQSVGQLPVDVRVIGCDALVTTGRKFLRAPRGTGFLYVSRELLDRLRPSAPDVRGALWSGEHEFELADSARRFETWEAAHAMRLGLGVALAEIRATGIEAIAAHVSGLSALLRGRLVEEVPGARIADPPESASGIVTFVLDGEAPQRTQERLAAAGCHTVVVPASHGLWDLQPRGLAGVVRASFHVYNGEDDVEAVIGALRSEGSAAGVVGGDGAATRGGGGGNGAAADGTTAGDGASQSAASPALPIPARGVDHFDAVVAGAGVHGRSAAWNLARQGKSVLLLERGRIGHAEGSSHGATRMIRRAYPSAVWDALVDRAYSGWAELEEAAGRPLLTTTGGIYAHPAGVGGGLRGPGCEAVDAATARRIAPALELGEEFDIIHDPAAGVLDASGTMAALLELGRDAGVEVRDATPLLSWTEDDDGVLVETPRGAIRTGRLVLCPGPWTGALVPELAQALRVTRIVNVELAGDDRAAVAPPNLGVFSLEVPDVGLLYGIPAINGRGLKVGLDDGPPEGIESPPPPVSAAEAEKLLDLVRRFIPSGVGPVAEGIACRYTMAPRNRFAVGPLPGKPRILLGAACSGHGFKFAPAIGAALADLASGRERPDLEFITPAALATAV
jgi:selenocysteine lyase/cysteine desulfurase/glycine/D-amino acid oxidase-like deaminating enzyme